MKILNKIIFVVIAGWFFASCNYLDVVPDNIATIDDAFSDRYQAESFLATCYWDMPKSAGWNENPAIFGALEMVFNKEHQWDGGFQAGLGNDSPTNPRINYWGGTGNMIHTLYGGINDCNIFLEKIGGVKDLNMYEKRRWIAEVMMLKAYMHFYLVTYYGPMCPLKQNTPVTVSTRGVRVYRQKIDDCFGYVFELLDSVIASNALPRIIDAQATELGRFTQAAAYMLKAKALVYWASPLFNGNTDYNSFLNENGEPFFNQKYDANRWKLAADACKRALQVCDSSGVHLYQTSDYVNAKPMSDSTRIVMVLRSAVSERWNPEIVWGNSSYPVNWGLQSPCFPKLEKPDYSSTSGIMSVPLHIVDKFYSNHGVPIEEDIDYPYTERFNVRTGDFDHRFYIQQGEQTAAMNFDREPRFYSTLGFDRGKWYGNSHINPDDDSQCLYPKARYGEFSSVFQPGDYNVTGYWPKKLVSVLTTWQNNNSVITETYPFPDMRFADLLLFTAEALNESKSAPDNEVYQYIDAVRARAGLEGVVDSWSKYSTNPSKPLTKEGMREIIQRERASEFACEGQYFWDSHRWKTAMKEQNRPIQGWDWSKSNVQDYYTVTTLYTQRFTYRNYFAPIPERDIINNPLLVQNPGW